MGVFVISLVVLFAITGVSDAAYCVCNDGLSNDVYQKNIDYACGAGADCTPISQNGPCFQPNTVKDHCNYAVNSYFQKKGQTPMSCSFSNSATVTQSPPSSSTSGCVYPSSPGGGGTGGGTPSTAPPSGGSPGGTTPVGGTPGGTTPVGGTPGSTTPVGGTPGSSTPVGGTPGGVTPVGGNTGGGTMVPGTTTSPGLGLGPTTGSGFTNTDSSATSVTACATTFMTFFLTLLVSGLMSSRA